MAIKIGILNETDEFERRVAARDSKKSGCRHAKSWPKDYHCRHRMKF
jgi:hypothetical protein